jgi:DNA-binding response OmpR family regulator
MATILIADDEQLIRRLIGDQLVREGHTVLEAEDGLQAISLFKANRKEIKLCILDIMMPEMDGWEVCRKIREVSGVPVMLVSARSQDFDQIMGFESGADDYVTKPFSLAILSKRIETLLQRGETQQPTKPVKEEIYEFEGLVLDSESYEVTLNGEIVELTVKEFEILKLLIISGEVSPFFNPLYANVYSGLSSP